MTSNTLVRLAQRAEEAASGLVVFKDNLGHDTAPKITEVIGELFAISAELLKIDNAYKDARLSARLGQIRDDVLLVYQTTTRTLEHVFLMFARLQQDTYQVAWDDLNYNMRHEELVGLSERLRWYHEFLRNCLTSLRGRAPEHSASLRKRLAALLERQEAVQLAQSGLVLDGADRTPRPNVRRHTSSFRIDPPISPTSISDHWDYERPPPIAPDPPAPNSPTFTTDSSQSLLSSRTSYSTGMASSETHWVGDVFDGSYPQTPFRLSHKRDDRSQCYGNVNPSALTMLGADGFERILELPFDRETAWLRLYWRPHDGRARILFVTQDELRRDLQYCVPLTSLKVIRDKSCLQLCRASRDERYVLWAKLNFALYEKMVLFYSTFVALKHQDGIAIHHQSLLDVFELREDIEYAGQIRDGPLLHGLRLFRDRGSGVVRLEASALRGPMQDVPLWTAFLTKYVGDPDHFQEEGRGKISVITLRPPPYYFHGQYEMPVDRYGGYTLNFTSSTDARGFMDIWKSLCRRAGRS